MYHRGMQIMRIYWQICGGCVNLILCIIRPKFILLWILYKQRINKNDASALCLQSYGTSQCLKYVFNVIHQLWQNSWLEKHCINKIMRCLYCWNGISIELGANMFFYFKIYQKADYHFIISIKYVLR